MPVKYFVSKDSQGREQVPDYPDETLAVIKIIKNVYADFNHTPNLYAIISNLNKRNAMADLVVITERGLGVIELKHKEGRIFQKGAIWYVEKNRYVEKHPIPGNKNVGYRNPHEQVQIYTETIRDKLINPPKRSFPWLSGGYTDWEQFQFATAVCFTHDRSIFDGFRKWYYREKRRYNSKIWERFWILKPAEISEWIIALSFGKCKTYPFGRYRLSAKQIMRIVTDLFGATEWTEIDKLMTGKPYAYLVMKQDGKMITSFDLISDEVTIGRNHEICNISTPEECDLVSKEHAKIQRTINGIFIQDTGSKNGTFIDEEQVDKPVCLQPGQQITLGGRKIKDRVCLLEFTYELPEHSSTQLGSQF